MTSESVADLHGHLTMCNAIIVLLLNLLLPGLGTVIATRYVSARKVLLMQREHQDTSKRIKTSLIFHVDQMKKRSRRLGLFQVLTFPILLFGWVWALYTSIKII
mmetsp:Transcript_5629/g.7502  ORF Transcript_5629/g.7502 Transcript_5629/m.7502 type:complete len:104 (+) Transcript_5629:812-1123(+)